MHNIAKKVKLYLERAKKGDVENYPMCYYSHWKIRGGMKDDTTRKTIDEIVEGRFIDAIAYAIQQPQFYANECRQDNPGNPHNGEIEEATVLEVHHEGLLKELRKPDEEF